MEKRRTILLAEDEPNDVLLMQRTVRKMGDPVSLLTVKDGEEAIEYLSGKGKYADRDHYPWPDLIVLDIKMPRKNGFDVLAWLKAHETTNSIPVVMLSSSKVKMDGEKAQELGANAYMVKPASFQELQQLFTQTEDFLAVHTIQPFH